LSYPSECPLRESNPAARDRFPPVALAPCGAPRHGEHRRRGDRRLGFAVSLAPNGVVLVSRSTSVRAEALRGNRTHVRRPGRRSLAASQ